jgi:NAD(P)H-dependent FMN reductase
MNFNIRAIFLLIATASSLSAGAKFDQEIDLNQSPKVLLFAGSLRQDSDNKKLIKETANFATQLGADVTVIDLKDYPFYFYDEDEEEISGMPENAKKIRDLMLDSQIIFIASPNYNNSFPAIVKNILDWTSRNEEAEASREAYKGKTFALMSAGYGPKGGVKGLPHLRAVIANIGGNVMKQEFGVPDAYDAFDEQGLLIDSELKAKLLKFVENTLRDGSKST